MSFTTRQQQSDLASSKFITAWEKLAQQFQREGRLSTAAAELVAHGQICLLAWEGPVLSGCSHDKINGLCRSLMPDLLNQPPIWLRLAQDKAEGLTPAAWRKRLIAGEAVTEIWSTTVTNLGQWRAAPFAAACQQYSLA